MNITFVQPYTHGRTTLRPLGLGYLASVLKKDHNITIIDSDVCKIPLEAVAKKALSTRPDIVGISANVLNKWTGVSLAEMLKDSVKYIVFGGPEVTLSPEFFLTRENFYLLKGDAEKTLPLFIDFVNGGPIKKVKILSYLRDGKIINNELIELEENLDNIPFPDTDLFEMDKYQVQLHGKKLTNIISSRGCPFKCIFCYSILNKRFRQRSPQNIIDEMKMLNKKYGYEAFKFFDDNFFMKKEFVQEFCEKLHKNRLSVYWQCQGRVKHIDKDVLKMMYRAGCRRINLGVETGSPRSLKLLRKSSTVEANARAIDLCRKAGIETKSYLTVGYPWETKADVMLTVNFLKKHPPTNIQTLIVFPFPNTELERMVREKGYKIDPNVLRGARDLDVPSYETENFTKDDLIKWRKLIIDTHKNATTPLLKRLAYKNDFLVRTVRKLKTLT
ncbi:MAG: radical SAM protein [Candidatus Omnitrophica bacterium]|nr:radical SAM protein [Candidatus Omnitrophota bacterium]